MASFGGVAFGWREKERKGYSVRGRFEMARKYLVLGTCQRRHHVMPSPPGVATCVRTLFVPGSNNDAFPDRNMVNRRPKLLLSLS